MLSSQIKADLGALHLIRRSQDRQTEKQSVEMPGPEPEQASGMESKLEQQQHEKDGITGGLPAKHVSRSRKQTAYLRAV